MLYKAFQAQTDALAPWRLGLDVAAALARHPAFGLADNPFVRHLVGTRDLANLMSTSHKRPDFGIAQVKVGNQIVSVREEAADRTPFATLLHFAKHGVAGQPKLLLVAPMSGHFATLLRGTARTALSDMDVYITDWHNARDVRLADGAFEFDDYVEHVMRFLRVLGPGCHVLAVCQPAVAVLAAVALMAEARDEATPRTMTLMAGPIDTRVNPTVVNDLAQSRDMDWFERNLIATVPWRFQGAGRRVYPGFVQLASFMAMNLERHLDAHRAHYRHVLTGQVEKAEAHRQFYEEYMAVMDLPAEFYLQTIQRVFQEFQLARGVMTYRGQTVDPTAIRRTALLTVEGELDDICGIGQTMAALDLCNRIPVAHKRHHLQTGAGHYGVFNGRRWRDEVYPLVREMVEIYTP